MASPILSREDLPAIGSERERPDVDAKQNLDENKRGMLANDIAAFANASGGNILVGACTSDQGSTFDSYPGLSLDRAETIGRAFEEAARDYCRPAPFVASRLIPIDDGRVVLAVYIGASASGPVGVKMMAPGNEKRGADSWFFPLRVGSQTRCVMPDQFATLEPMGARRAFALLRTIPREEWNAVDVYAKSKSHGADAPYVAWKAELLAIDESVNVVRLDVTTAHMGTPREVPFSIPGDWIDSVWRDPAKGRWQLALSCDLKFSGQGGHGVPNR